jgi:hypothetical protein
VRSALATACARLELVPLRHTLQFFPYPPDAHPDATPPPYHSLCHTFTQTQGGLTPPEASHVTHPDVDRGTHPDLATSQGRKGKDLETSGSEEDSMRSEGRGREARHVAG